MRRRDFLSVGLLSTLAGVVGAPTLLNAKDLAKKGRKGKAKNIIFLVSDGMSHGTLNMADLFLQRKEGKGSNWIGLYRDKMAKRAYMDTASADSMVTDSAAGSSSWGGGKRVFNGTLNVNADGSYNKPILQKFKEAGKSVGCVTTVPITHATPAGFSVNMESRNRQDLIASEYLKLKFDVMMGGGIEYFNGKDRKDKKDILPDFVTEGFDIAYTKADMKKAAGKKPLLGVFCEDGLPYTLDHDQDSDLVNKIPKLSEMTEKAISLMSSNNEGFVLQVEGGKVDWAAHANDAAALIYDQVEFDKAVEVALKFAEGRDDTLVVITTDHGNANPGLIKNHHVDSMFDTFQTAKHTNEWIINGTTKNDSTAALIDKIHHAQGYKVSDDEAKYVLSAFNMIDQEGVYVSNKLPYERLAEVQQKYTSVFWAGMNHSGDFVELGMYGPGAEDLPPMVKNYELHNFMLEAAGVNKLA